MAAGTFDDYGIQRTAQGVQSADDRPINSSFLFATSGVVAAGVATATIPAIAGKKFYVEGYDIVGTGATAATAVVATVTGLSAVKSEPVVVPAGANLGITPVRQAMFPAIPASAVNTAVVLSVPSFGAGNTRAIVSIWGHYR